MVEIDVGELLREYIVATIAALVVQKVPDYVKTVGEKKEREKLQYTTAIVREVVRQELEGYKDATDARDARDVRDAKGANK